MNSGLLLPLLAPVLVCTRLLIAAGGANFVARRLSKCRVCASVHGGWRDDILTSGEYITSPNEALIQEAAAAAHIGDWRRRVLMCCECAGPCGRRRVLLPLLSTRDNNGKTRCSVRFKQGDAAAVFCCNYISRES